ncbi:hypothetical protein ACFRIB_29965 [Streptomyces mirabilis]|uniref:hypothetical protein n=1 Tax=Streptomyces mirabilis TaxID=68239 RepID=UPI0036AF7FCE
MSSGANLLTRIEYEVTKRSLRPLNAVLQAWPVRRLSHQSGGFKRSFCELHKTSVIGDKLDPEESLLRDHAAVVRLRLRIDKRQAALIFQSSMERVVLRTAISDDGFGKAAVGGQAFLSSQPPPGEGFGAVRRPSLEKECDERSKQGTYNGHEACQSATHPGS